MGEEVLNDLLPVLWARLRSCGQTQSRPADSAEAHEVMVRPLLRLILCYLSMSAPLWATYRRGPTPLRVECPTDLHG